MRKFGVSYNVFDGIEHLEKSIDQIRNFVDYISVVYQLKSNHGNWIEENDLNYLRKLFTANKIDKFYEYTPDLKISPHENELNKRNIGLHLSKINGCDYHMSMDCDEYYLINDFKFLINYHNNNDVDISYCKMLTYYKENNIILDPPEEYYVSLFNKIKNDTCFILGTKCDVTVDPTRKVRYSKNIKIFERNELEMMHLSYVRENIEQKFSNSSANTNFNKENIKKTIDHYNNWKFPDKALLLGKDIYFYNVKINNNLRNEISKNII